MVDDIVSIHYNPDVVFHGSDAFDISSVGDLRIKTLRRRPTAWVIANLLWVQFGGKSMYRFMVMQFWGIWREKCIMYYREKGRRRLNNYE